MKPLFDQNLSPKLTDRLADTYPGSKHASEVGLDRAMDREVWAYAEQSGFTIVSKDSDFSEMSLLWGFPPHVVWIRRGNCTTADIETVLRKSRTAIERLDETSETGIVTLY